MMAVALWGGLAVAAGASGSDGDRMVTKELMQDSGALMNRFDGKPYKVYPDGKVDFASYRGFNLYGNICARCHGTAGLGTSFAPALADSLKFMTYHDFVSTVINGRKNINSGSNSDMPSFGDNPTIVRYLDSIYAYLKGRADGAIGPGILNWEGPKDE